MSDFSKIASVYIHFETIDSTNHWAKGHLSTFERDTLTILSADRQTAAYGQKKRLWLAPEGEGLWATFCLYVEGCDSFLLTRAMADALLVLLAQEGIEGQIKWPNDIVVGKKKIAGILTEVADNFALIGVGLNVNMPKTRFVEVDQPITSLLALTKKTFCTKVLLRALAERFKKNIVTY